MPTTVYKARDRGHFDFGWLNTHHIFSFGQYYDPTKMHFGVLRVFNDDVVAPGAGFGTHPHENMEIISIPLSGAIMHRDSMGTEQALTPGEVQVMSAGTGITHSEYNGSDNEELHFLQIWIYPNERDVEPRYDQKHIDLVDNGIASAVGPQGGSAPLWIHQNAWIDIATLSAGATVSIEPKVQDHGVFIFMIHGTARVSGMEITDRDAIGVDGEKTIDLTSLTDSKAVVLHVPMR
jgi:quercetin 2,3-dioxygenase